MSLVHPLQERLSDRAKPPLLAPGVFDGLSAVMAQKAGAEALYLSGASLAYTRFGRPDIGLISMAEVAETISVISDRVSLPLIVDADTGFGNALNVQRTVRLFAKAGASSIQLEDQTLPKRCGHLAGKTLVSRAEMVGKIEAAKDALLDHDCLLIARTDAIALEGLERALERAECYLDAGADILFVEAPPDQAAMTAITSRFADRVPLVANMVEGGKTPLLPLSELGVLGFQLVIYPGAFVRALSYLGTHFYRELIISGGTQDWQDRMLDLTGLNDLLGTQQLLDLGRKYDPEAER